MLIHWILVPTGTKLEVSVAQVSESHPFREMFSWGLIQETLIFWHFNHRGPRCAGFGCHIELSEIWKSGKLSTRVVMPEGTWQGSCRSAAIPWHVPRVVPHSIITASCWKFQRALSYLLFLCCHFSILAAVLKLVWFSDRSYLEVK